MAKASDEFVINLLINVGNSLEKITSLKKGTEEYATQINKLEQALSTIAGLSGKPWGSVADNIISVAADAGTATDQLSKMKTALMDAYNAIPVDPYNKNSKQPPPTFQSVATSESSAKSAEANNEQAAAAQAAAQAYREEASAADMAVTADNEQSTAANASASAENEQAAAARNAAMADKEEAAASEKSAKANEKQTASAGKATQGFNVMRSAMGFFVAQLMSKVTQAIGQFVSESIASFKKLRGELAQLNFAENILSKKGMDITRQELDDFINDIQEKYSYLSKLQATSIVSDVADMATEFGYTKQQMQDLAGVIAFIQTKEQMLGEEMSDSGSILNAMADARSNYFNKLGINITDALVKEKAYEMGLAKQGSELGKAEKMQAALALATEQTAGKSEELLAAIRETNPALAEQMQYEKRIGDLQLEAGKKLSEITDAWHRMFNSIEENGGNVSAFLDATVILLKALATILVVVWDAVVGLTSLLVGVGLAGVASAHLVIEAFKSAYKAITGEWSGSQAVEHMRKVGQAWGTALKDGLKQTAGMYLDPNELWKDSPASTKTDTPTANKAGEPDINPDIDMEGKEGVKQAFEDLKKDIEDKTKDLEKDKYEASIDLQIKLEDIDIEFGQKVEDTIRKYTQDVEDEMRKYSQTVSDIESDSNQQIAEATAKFHQEQLDDEQKFQNELLKMREDYLMDLEEALHERDARQILRLMKEYNLKKQQAIRDHQLEKKQGQQDFQAEISRLESEKQQRLAQAQEEHNQKLEDLEIAKEREMEENELWREREQEAANRDYQRKLADLQRQYKYELQMLAQKLREEYNLTAQQSAALISMLSGNLNAYSQYVQQVVAQTNAATASMTSTGAGAGSTTGNWLTGNPTGTNNTTGTQNQSATITGISGNQVTVSQGGVLDTIARWVGDATNWVNSIIPWNAEGGSFIANKPTIQGFGEKGSELVTAIPLNRMNQVSSPLGIGAGGQMGSGNITIALDLSPDLEGRIISRTLDETANVVMRTRRTK